MVFKNNIKGIKTKIINSKNQIVTSGNKPNSEGGVKEKNPAAVALGRLGGLRGGRARAEKLGKRARRKIAKAAALARWSKRSVD